MKGEGGWRLDQPEPGVFRWTSPLRRTYHVLREPVTCDLPGPLPRLEQYPDYAPPVIIDENGPILHRPPPKPDPRSPPAPAADPDEPPPF